MIGDQAKTVSRLNWLVSLNLRLQIKSITDPFEGMYLINTLLNDEFVAITGDYHGPGKTKTCILRRDSLSDVAMVNWRGADASTYEGWYFAEIPQGMIFSNFNLGKDLEDKTVLSVYPKKSLEKVPKRKLEDVPSKFMGQHSIKILPNGKFIYQGCVPDVGSSSMRLTRLFDSNLHEIASSYERLDDVMYGLFITQPLQATPAVGIMMNGFYTGELLTPANVAAVNFSEIKASDVKDHGMQLVRIEDNPTAVSKNDLIIFAQNLMQFLQNEERFPNLQKREPGWLWFWNPYPYKLAEFYQNKLDMLNGLQELLKNPEHEKFPQQIYHLLNKHLLPLLRLNTPEANRDEYVKNIREFFSFDILAYCKFLGKPFFQTISPEMLVPVLLQINPLLAQPGLQKDFPKRR